jgi:threonine/homoserine/homoserine lactone efflux protein
VQLAMVVEGVGSIVTESEPVFTAIRVAGAAYLIVLGVRVVRDRRRRQSGLRKVACFSRFSSRAICHGLPSVATAWLHK